MAHIWFSSWGDEENDRGGIYLILKSSLWDRGVLTTPTLPTRTERHTEVNKSQKLSEESNPGD